MIRYSNYSQEQNMKCKNNNIGGPRAPACSQLSEIGDVMQHFPNPFITTNERIIVRALLGFEKEECL